MNKTKLIKPRILIGNAETLDKMGQKRGLSRKEFIKSIAIDRFIFMDQDLNFLFKAFGLSAPFEEKDVLSQFNIEITPWTTQRFSVEVTEKTEMALYRQAYKKGCVGPYAIANLLNRICVNDIVFINENIGQAAKSKTNKFEGGKK